LIFCMLTSCTSKQSNIKNPGLIITAGDITPEHWQLEESRNFVISKMRIGSNDKPILSSRIPGEIRLSQTLSLDSGEYFLLAKYKANVEKGAFLSSDAVEKASLVATFSSGAFDEASTPYLRKYIADPQIRDGYCQKSSLSLDELIRLYKIPTRQLHWQINCSGIHQFLEYWNAYDEQWKIIDPYYGIRYVDINGSYMNFEEVENLVRNKKFGNKNIKQIDIGHLIYSESEILDGWINADLAIHVKE